MIGERLIENPLLGGRHLCLRLARARFSFERGARLGQCRAFCRSLVGCETELFRQREDALGFAEALRGAQGLRLAEKRVRRLLPRIAQGGIVRSRQCFEIFQTALQLRHPTVLREGGGNLRGDRGAQLFHGVLASLRFADHADDCGALRVDEFFRQHVGKFPDERLDTAHLPLLRRGGDLGVDQGFQPFQRCTKRRAAGSDPPQLSQHVASSPEVLEARACRGERRGLLLQVSDLRGELRLGVQASDAILKIEQIRIARREAQSRGEHLIGKSHLAPGEGNSGLRGIGNRQTLVVEQRMRRIQLRDYRQRALRVVGTLARNQRAVLEQGFESLRLAQYFGLAFRLELID